MNITELSNGNVRLSSPSGKILDTRIKVLYDKVVVNKREVKYFIETQATPDEIKSQHKTYTRRQVVKAMEKVPQLYEYFFNLYKTNDKLNFWWNTVLDIDPDDSDFKSICESTGITNEQITQIIGVIK